MDNGEVLVGAAIVILLITGVYSLQQINNQDQEQPGNNTPENISVVAENLDVPWSITFLPDGDMLVTERPGTLLRIERENENFTETYTVDGVKHQGEGGLLGIAKHPDFEENNWIYLYMTTQDGDMLENRVIRYTLQENNLTEPMTVISGLPGAPYHDGGRIEFGPFDKLYITAGDATNSQWAQNINIRAGKILRINPDGTVPGENPFNNSVYSYGHRNPQGLVWIKGQIWATEHGRSGLQSGMDELNRIQSGGNYGWPVIEGDQRQPGMINPVFHSGPDITWAPAGAEYTNGSIYFAGLRGKTLYEAKIEDSQVQELDGHLQNTYGRLRAVQQGPEGDLYISTSNTDGRGNPSENDDRIIRVDPGTLN